MALAETGSLYYWGGDRDEEFLSDNFTPRLITNVMGVKDIYAGSDVDLAILNPGEIIGWQEIITKSKDGRKALIGPIQIPDGEIAIKVVGNYMRSLILAKSGKVFTHYGSVYHGAKYANEVQQEIVGLENIVDCALGVITVWP